jgi:ABC-2 type transport system ATP-binding protein
VLEASALCRRFGSRTAVENVSLEISPGEVFALLGPNGAGKTTTLRMLAGLIAPSSGAVRVDGETVERRTASRLRARIGFLTEAPGLWDRLTVRQNLVTFARLYGLDAPERAVAAALDAFEVGDRADDPAAVLSKGLKQRVALARTLIHRPTIVLLDEPTSGLDPESARKVRELVVRLRDSGHAVLLSTHNLDEVQRVATRVAVLRTTLIATGTPSALRARLFDVRVRVDVRGDAGRLADAVRAAGVAVVRANRDALSVGLESVRGAGLDTPDVVRLLVERGAAIDRVALEEATLEDVYLRLLGRDETRS